MKVVNKGYNTLIVKNEDIQDIEEKVVTVKSSSKLSTVLNWHIGIAALYVLIIGTTGVLIQCLNDGLTEHQHEMYQFIDKNMAQPFLLIYAILITFISTISFTVLYCVFNVVEVQFPYNEASSKSGMIAFNIAMGAINIYFLPSSVYAFPIYIMFYLYNCSMYGNAALIEASIVISTSVALIYSRKIFYLLLKAFCWDPTVCSIYLSYLVFNETKKWSTRYETIVDTIV